MKTLHFKTNINCGGCLATISPVLNQKANIQEWDVDIKSPDKTRTITSEDEVKEILQKVGFKAEAL